MTDQTTLDRLAAEVPEVAPLVHIMRVARRPYYVEQGAVYDDVEAALTAVAERWQVEKERADRAEAALRQADYLATEAYKCGWEEAMRQEHQP